MSVIPDCPVFKPTWEEFQNFEKYVESIEPLCAEVGLAKIIPPPEWVARTAPYTDEGVIIPTPIIQECTGKQGVYEFSHIEKRAMTLSQLRVSLASEPGHGMNPRDFEGIERAYWERIQFRAPLYGADIQGSFFDEDLRVWNLAHLGDCLHLLGQIPGVNNPYQYFGTWKSTFCWHTEDLDLYSINYLHWGEPKAWYAIPPVMRHQMEKFAAAKFPDQARDCHAFLRHKSFHLQPQLLLKEGIPVVKATQEVGQFIITFPAGYHAGFNHGLNCAEAVNFALRRWLPMGRAATVCRCFPYSVRINVDDLEAKINARNTAIARKLLDGASSPSPIIPEIKDLVPAPESTVTETTEARDVVMAEESADMVVDDGLKTKSELPVSDVREEMMHPQSLPASGVYYFPHSMLHYLSDPNAQEVAVKALDKLPRDAPPPQPAYILTPESEAAAALLTSTAQKGGGRMTGRMMVKPSGSTDVNIEDDYEDDEVVKKPMVLPKVIVKMPTEPSHPKIIIRPPTAPVTEPVITERRSTRSSATELLGPLPDDIDSDEDELRRKEKLSHIRRIPVEPVETRSHKHHIAAPAPPVPKVLPKVVVKVPILPPKPSTPKEDSVVLSPPITPTVRKPDVVAKPTVTPVRLTSNVVKTPVPVAKKAKVDPPKAAFDPLDDILGQMNTFENQKQSASFTPHVYNIPYRGGR